MDLRWLAVATRTTRHLIELDLAKRQMVQHHVTNARDINSFTKGRSCNQHLQATFTEQRFNTFALRARKARIVETNQRGNMRLLLAKASGKRDGFHARINVDQSFFALALPG